MTSMGKGTIYLMISNFIFLGSGYFIHVGLGRFLGPREYGIFGIIIAILTFIGLSLRSGIPQAISKFIAEDRENSDIIIKKSAKLQFFFAVLVFLIFFLSSTLIASLLGDKELIPYIQLSSVTIFAYAAFNFYLNILNGKRCYLEQAKMASIYSLTKLVGVFFLVAIGLGVNGAIIGFIIAPLIGTVVGLRYVGIHFMKARGDFNLKRIIYFAAPVTMFMVGLNLLGSIDLFFIKSILLDNIYVGYYTASSTIARIPAFMVFGLNLALFPVISHSVAKKNRNAVSSYIKNSFRYMLMFILPIAFMINATSKDLLSLVYSTEYIPSTGPLQILIFGWVFLSLFQLLATILNAGGNPIISLYIVIISVLISIILNFFLIPIYGLSGAALSTTAAGLFGLTVAMIYVNKLYNSSIGLISFLRIFSASIIIYFILTTFNSLYNFLPLKYLIFFLIYFLILVLIKEVDSKDFETFKQVLKKDEKDISIETSR